MNLDSRPLGSSSSFGARLVAAPGAVAHAIVEELEGSPRWLLDRLNAAGGLLVLSGMQGKPWLVLGDMKELGDESRKMHWEVGEAAKAMGVRRLFTTGDLAAVTSEAFGDGAEHYSSREDLAEALCARLRPGVICLVKGSRSMGMETVVEAVKKAAGMREAS